MTVNHLAMSESVPRVPEIFSSGPSGTNAISGITPKGEKPSRVGFALPTRLGYLNLRRRNMKRIIIEKKEQVNVKARELLEEFKGYLGIEGLEKVRVLNVYEIFNAADEQVKEIIDTVLYEPQLDTFYEGSIELAEDEKAFRVESLRGQYNQREDAVNNMVSSYLGFEEVTVKHSEIIILKNISQEDLDKVKAYHINPTESREVPLDYVAHEKEGQAPDQVEIVEDFLAMNINELNMVKEELGLGMDIEDLAFCQNYFREELRDPTVAELKIIDTYWSDHCRHRTFATELVHIDLDEGQYREIFEKAIAEYLSSREYVYGDKKKPICLMDLATINMKEIKKKGLLEDKEESDEINAASIEVDVDVDGNIEKWLLMFKNETHNHPTEIEPFGGANTCLGGAIRDPLSGRSYVYQAMRITGAADPRSKYEETLKGKIPQRKITTTAMEGYSSYGYQIGSTTGYVQEFYHEGFVAKRMELGALVAAAPKDWVVRKKPEKGDLVLLIGGRTGRDGIGAAVGSSKEHTDKALEVSGAEVQKGNPIIERKIVRLFRRPEVTRLIKKCNDFGAGGVAVAVGELADGICIDLDKVLLKYPGLNCWETALAESQERMAVLISRKDIREFRKYLQEEDVEGTVIAEVNDENRLRMVWRGKKVAEIKREFLDTSGVNKKSKVKIISPRDRLYLKENPDHISGKDIVRDFIENMAQLNTGSQKGLIERFDHTVGAGTVLMPLGGKHKLTPEEGMVAKLPVLKGNTSTCSIMTCGYDPFLSEWSPFHGGYYAVIESIAKVVALGGDFRRIRLSFQEYFERLGTDPVKWGKPFSALLGAFLVQKNLDIPSIGGKDSMSGTFEDIDVPPTLVSFAVTTEKIDRIVSKEFKKPGSKVVVVNVSIDEKGLVDFAKLKKSYIRVKELIDKGHVLSSSTIRFGGIARSICEMAFGNRIGFEFASQVLDRIYKPLYGSIVLEIEEEANLEDLFEGIDYTLIGRTIEAEHIKLEGEIILLDDIIEAWERTLKEVFPVKEERRVKDTEIVYSGGSRIKRIKSLAKPKVLIPVFAGTNGEYDMALQFERAGAEVETFVFKTLSQDLIEESLRELADKIKECQILGFANGHILGNEPETAGKLIKLLFEKPVLKEAVNEHLKVRDGLVLGIGSGLNALIKLGLIEKGEISSIDESSPYIAPNESGKFISTLVHVKVVSNLSPWLSGMKVGDLYTVPIATREGRIILGGRDLAPGQISTQYAELNPTGSQLGIESLTSPEGRVFGTVTSIDRIGEDIYKNVEIKGIPNIFQAGVNYYK